MNDGHLLGHEGEDTAVRYLEKKGLTLVERSFQTRWGEIDAIFKNRREWVFVEVKTRSRISSFPAIESITPSKQKRLMNAALMYMKKNRLEGNDMRFDVVLLEGGRIDWIPNVFEGSAKYTY